MSWHDEEAAGLLAMHTLLCSFLLLVQEPPPTPIGRARVAFTYHERLIFLQGRIDASRELLFLLDTGASASAVDARTADELGLARGVAVDVEGSAGIARVETARAAVTVGPLAARALDVTVQDLARSLSPPGERLDAILGSDYCAAFALELDFPARSLTFVSGGREPLPAGVEALPLELDNGIPRLRAMLDDLETSLRIDTGASLFDTTDVYVNVTEAVWEELRRADPELAPERHFAGTGTGGSVTLPVARIHALTVGKTTIERPFVIVQPRQGYFARADAVGFLGNNFLEKLERVTIDYPEHRLVVGRGG